MYSIGEKIKETTHTKKTPPKKNLENVQTLGMGISQVERDLASPSMETFNILQVIGKVPKESS